MFRTGWAVVFSTLLLSGCYAIGGSSPQTRFYALESLPAEPLASSPAGVRVGIGPVRIPDSLQRPQIVTRSTTHERNYADFDHWAGSLEGNILRVLGRSLMHRLPEARVQLHPWPHTRGIDYQVRIVVIEMEGRRGETATLVGTLTWLDLDSRNELAHERFELHATPANGTYQALVAAWSELVNLLGERIAARAATLPRNGVPG